MDGQVTSKEQSRGSRLAAIDRTNYMASLPAMNGVHSRPISAADFPRLLQLCQSCTDFYELVEGHPPSDETAAEIVGPLDAKYARGTKHV